MKKAYLIYGLSSLVFFILSIFSDGTIEIANHDTFLILANSHLFIGLGFLFIFYFLVSFIFSREHAPFNGFLVFIHWFLSVSGIAALPTIYQKILIEKPVRYYDYSVYDTTPINGNNSDLNHLLLIVLLITMIVQLLFFINLIVSLVRKKV